MAGRRLEALLEQAIDAQLRRCMFHNNHRVAVSLLTDYVAGAEQIPTRTVQARRSESRECAHRAKTPGKDSVDHLGTVCVRLLKATNLVAAPAHAGIVHCSVVLCSGKVMQDLVCAGADGPSG